MDDWTQKLEAGGQIDVIYTDLEKAFDKVPHRFLLYKLSKYNVDPFVYHWIESFLYKRRQRVVVNCAHSDYSDVISGISQGSVLGPILFLMYINDLVKYCNSESTLFLYADDTKIYKYIKNDEDRKTL